ncbi:MAG: peptidoglycan DD-metalloendopeptidase family protein [Oscillospiraceae bacterium]|nr:peptidoglycan DD-metalloendopeptidase family protein [Oscillospiraceae bacterium]
MDNRRKKSTEKETKPVAERTGVLNRIAVSAKNMVASEKHHFNVIAMVLCVVAVSFAVIASPHTIAVAINGATVGYADSEQDVDEVVSEAQDKISEALGYDYPLEDSVTVRSVLASTAEDTSAASLENAIIESVDDVEMLWTVEVDGVTAAASRDRYTIVSVLESIRAGYSVGKNCISEFVNTIEIVQKCVSVSDIRTAAEIADILSPEAEDSAFALKVRTIAEESDYTLIPFGTTYIEDRDLFVGITEKVSDGVPGRKSTKYSVEFINGVEQSRTEIDYVIVKAPENEVQRVGTKQRTIYDSHGAYIWPANGTITSEYGYRNGPLGDPYHRGLDIASYPYADIVASDSGEVIKVAYHSSYGLYIKIRHDNGDITMYAHCADTYVSEGERVYQGQLIAAMGETGEADGVHLHFEIRTGPDEESQNPICYLPW